MQSPLIERISFRPMNMEADLSHIYEWLSDPDVRRWYDEGEHTLENYRQQFAPESTVHKLIILVDDLPVGYVQAYRLSDEPEYARQIGLNHDAVSLDIFIGDADYRGGWGSLILRRVLNEIVFGTMDAEFACCNPDPENTRAVRAYEKAGFHGDRVVWIEDESPGNTGYERIMLISRDEFYGAAS